MLTLKINDLSYENSSKIIFEHASIEIDFQNLVITGRNGVGKTTLLDLIIKGHNKLAITKGDKSASIGRVYQEYKLINNYSVYNNCLVFNVNPKLFLEILSKFETKIDIKNKVKTLSGGQKQIINICIVLAKNYDVYLLDEPLNNLDKEIKSKLIEYLNLTNKCCIVVSHEQLNLENSQYIKIYKRNIIHENNN